MAEAEAEAAFLRSMQALNENGNGYLEPGDASGEQIDSSDEYDPAQDVQDVSLSAPQSSAHHPSLEPSANVAPRTAPNPLSPPPIDGTAAQGQPAVSVQNIPVPDQTSLTSPPSVNTQAANEMGSAVTDSAKTTTPVASTPKARLPHDRIGILEDRIKEDEKGDTDAWLGLIGEYRKRGKLDEARRVYDRFFAVFPSAVGVPCCFSAISSRLLIRVRQAEQWVARAQMENEAQNRAGVEAIFNKTLADLPSLQLWQTYLDHIRRYYNVTTDQSQQASQINHAAYNAVLDAVGIDKDSGKLWQDFLQFIKSTPGAVGGSNWQDQQKMDVLRKAYQRAICIPTQSVESIWKEYSAFEMGLNKLTVCIKIFFFFGLCECKALIVWRRAANSSRRNRRPTCPLAARTLSFKTLHATSCERPCQCCHLRLALTGMSSMPNR
jgi:cleavage stimulation factor subunit 3